MFYQKRPTYSETPKIEVPKLDENQLFILEALLIIRATQGDLHALRWLSDFESENFLAQDSLRGFLQLLDIHCVDIH